MGTHKRRRCSLAGQEGIRADFLEEAGVPGGLEPQRGLCKVPLGRVWPREWTRRERCRLVSSPRPSVPPSRDIPGCPRWHRGSCYVASGSHSTTQWAEVGPQCPSSVSGSGAPSGVSLAVGISWSGQCCTVHPRSPEPPEGVPHPACSFSQHLRSPRSWLHLLRPGLP